jgi:hypothetical protein
VVRCEPRLFPQRQHQQHAHYEYHEHHQQLLQQPERRQPLRTRRRRDASLCHDRGPDRSFQKYAGTRSAGCFKLGARFAECVAKPVQRQPAGRFSDAGKHARIESGSASGKTICRSDFASDGQQNDSAGKLGEAKRYADGHFAGSQHGNARSESRARRTIEQREIHASAGRTLPTAAAAEPGEFKPDVESRRERSDDGEPQWCIGADANGDEPQRASSAAGRSENNVATVNFAVVTIDAAGIRWQREPSDNERSQHGSEYFALLFNPVFRTGNAQQRSAPHGTNFPHTAQLLSSAKPGQLLRPFL